MRGGNGTWSPRLRAQPSAVVWGDFITGEVLGQLTSATGSVSDDVSGRASLQVDIGLEEWRRVRGQIQPWRHYLAWVTSGWVQAAGPVVHPPHWTPGGVTINAAGAEAWLDRVEVMVSTVVDQQLVVPVEKARGTNTSKTKVEWAPSTAARIVLADRSPRSIAAGLVNVALSWGEELTPPLRHTHFSSTEPGSMSMTWHGIDHKSVGDAMADVLAGVEWRLDPYWIDGDGLVMGWDLLVGEPELIRDPMPVGWPADAVRVLSVTGDGSRMASVSSATARNPDGMGINRVARAIHAPVLMSTTQVGRDSATGAEVQAVAAAGLRTAPDVQAQVALPTTRMHYLPLGSVAVVEWPADVPMSGDVRTVSYSVDLESLVMTATVIPAGGVRGRR